MLTSPLLLAHLIAQTFQKVPVQERENLLSFVSFEAEASKVEDVLSGYVETDGASDEEAGQTWVGFQNNGMTM